MVCVNLDWIRKQYRDIVALDAAISLMGWDKQVLMQPGGAEARNAQLESLSLLRYAKLTDDRFVQAVDDEIASADPDSVEYRELEVLRRDIRLSVALPAELVGRKAKVANVAYETWKVARASSDFALMAPYFTQLVEIAQETSAALGPAERPYDRLLDLYEEGATQADAEGMFTAMLPRLKVLLAKIREAEPVDDFCLRGNWEPAVLRGVAQRIAGEIGFRFDEGRLDLAPNAFCTHLDRRDVRMTTRASDHVKGVLSSSLHEMGHGLYEQNDDPWHGGTALAGGVSLAVHESQSRLWENIIGRSLPFWERFFPVLAEAVPELAPLGAEGFYRAYNRVEPTFIRVGADELTYNLHILIRFELEVELVEGRLAVADLPAAWNSKYEDYLGIVPPNDGLGCLQDVHWSRGSFGYFSTYAMGNVIGGAMWALMPQGSVEESLSWLTEKIYRSGRSVPPRALVESINGTYLDPGPWLDYADAKYAAIYGV
jgi:carboxypeptidase Taq